MVAVTELSNTVRIEGRGRRREELLRKGERERERRQGEELSIPSIIVMTPLLLSSFRCFPYGPSVSPRRDLLSPRQLERERERERRPDHFVSTNTRTYNRI